MAAALTDKAHSVSVIGIEAVPFKQALGEKVGKALMKVGTGEIHPHCFCRHSTCFQRRVLSFSSFLKQTG